MRVLVTGVAGYVGSVCAEALLARGHEVAGLDDLRSGHRAGVPPGVPFHHCDLSDHAALNRVFSSERIQAVMHFAAEALVEKSVREPSLFFFDNVACGVHLLDAMVRAGVKKFIFSSTAAVYGEPRTTPIPESHPKSPINPYGRSKLIFENILEEYRVCAGLQYVALRYFNAAGASPERGEDHRPESHLIPRVLQVALGQQQSAQVNGTDYPTRDGTCVRDYIHVLDIAESHILALEALDRVSGQAFNVGNSRGYSVMEVIEAARRVTGNQIPLVKAARRPGDPAVLVASSEKLRKELGWQPKRSDLETILRSAWEWKRRFPQGYPE